MAEICYQNETKIDEEDLSLSILDMSLKHGIPHMHVCGGRARCSTCRVAVVEHEEHLLPRNEAEADLAARKGLDPNIRLACQTRVRGDVALRRLVMDATDVELLGYDGEVKWKSTPAGLEVELPEKPPCDFAVTLKILGALAPKSAK